MGWKRKNQDELGGYPTEDLKYAHAPKLSRGMVPYLDHRRRTLKLGLVDSMREKGMGERGIGAHELGRENQDNRSVHPFRARLMSLHREQRTERKSLG